MGQVDTPEESRRFKLSRWLKYTIAGWFLCIPAILLVSGLIESIGLSSFNFPVGVGAGTAMGGMQALALRKVLRYPSRWLFTTAAGLTVPFLFLDLIRLVGHPLADMIYLAALSGGLLVGIFQATLIAELEQARARWILASTTAWGLTAGALWLADSIPLQGLSKGSHGIIAALVYLLIAGSGSLLLGLVTGKALTRTISNGR